MDRRTRYPQEVRERDWFSNRRLLEPIGDIPPAEFEGLYWLKQAANDTVGPKESSLH